jgi:hypothetical protein
MIPRMSAISGRTIGAIAASDASRSAATNRSILSM